MSSRFWRRSAACLAPPPGHGSPSRRRRRDGGPPGPRPRRGPPAEPPLSAWASPGREPGPGPRLHSRRALERLIPLGAVSTEVLGCSAHCSLMQSPKMNVQEQGFPLDLGASFTEDAPRPPVPGEEGELVSTDSRPVNHSFCSGKGTSIKSETSTATPRRSDLDLGYEPEGSASPTPPYLRWAESLHSLLDDQDGISLFRTFLKQEGCADLLDFWFACSGFRKLEPCDSNEEKRLKLARAIYRKYILDSNGIVSRQTKPATKSFIKDCVMKQQIDPAMFDQAQTEIQSTMEENTYPSFLKSDIYLEYTRTGSESPKVCSDQSSGSGTGKGMSGYLPTLNEDEEWKCDQDADEDDGRDPLPPAGSPRSCYWRLLPRGPPQVDGTTKAESSGMDLGGSPSTPTTSTLAMPWPQPPVPMTVSSRACPVMLTRYPLRTVVWMESPHTGSVSSTEGRCRRVSKSMGGYLYLTFLALTECQRRSG